MSEESQLIQEAQRGSVEAFGQLVRRYQCRLLKFVFYFVGNYYDAEEIAQEAFIRAFRALKKFRGESSFYTWLCAIACRLARRFLKNHVPGGGHVPVGNYADDPRDNPHEVNPSDHDPADELLREERIAAVRRAIEELPAKYRVVVLLVDIEGFDYQTAADVLKIPVNTIRSRLARARAKLRKSLAKWLQV